MIHICKSSSCDKVLAVNNKSGWCREHHQCKERLASDSEWSERRNSRRRERYRTDVGYRAEQLTRTRAWLRDKYYSDAKWREARQRQSYAINAHRRRTDTEYRARESLRQRVRRAQRGTGYRRMWRRLDKAQQNLCYLCGGRMYDDVSVDHIYPQVLGGGSEVHNLCAVHQSCNSRKGDRYDLFALAGA